MGGGEGGSAPAGRGALCSESPSASTPEALTLSTLTAEQGGPAAGDVNQPGCGARLLHQSTPSGPDSQAQP